MSGAVVHKRLLHRPADPAIVRLGEELGRILADEEERRELEASGDELPAEEEQTHAAGVR